jgi:hypothetical protein
MQGKPQLKQLRDLDLATIEKPKTLVILHYTRKRISVPLFKEVTELADLLYHHISTLEKQILSNDPDWEKKDNRQIVCFQIKKEEGSEKAGDGDLRSDILLSLLRIKGEQEVPELSLKIDFTKVYKYIEVEPYYRLFDPLESRYTSSAHAPYFSLHRLTASTRNANSYLARKINSGLFFAIKVHTSTSRVGLSESRVLDHMAYVDEQGGELRSCLLVRTQSVVFIPHPESESS